LAKLGSEKRPAVFRVQTMERLEEVAAICHENNIRYIGGIEPDKPENIKDVKKVIKRKSRPKKLI